MLDIDEMGAIDWFLIEAHDKGITASWSRRCSIWWIDG